MDEKKGLLVIPEIQKDDDEVLDYPKVLANYKKVLSYVAALYVDTINIIHFMHDKYAYESSQMALHDTLGGYTGVQTLSEQLDPRTLEPHYALLPVWMLHTRWKEQDFLFAMNGQTGKLIGDLPVDKGRVAAWFAGISIPLMILTALIMLL